MGVALGELREHAQTIAPHIPGYGGDNTSAGRLRQARARNLQRGVGRPRRHAFRAEEVCLPRAQKIPSHADDRRPRIVGLGAYVVAVLLAVMGLTAGAAWGAAGGLPGTGDKSFNPAGNTGDNHCVSPEGVDANELLGISDQLVLPGVCDVVQAGEFYVYFNAAWSLNSSWEAVPADYTPSAPTPVQDFISKVRSVTFAVDPGTKREHSYRYSAQDIMDVGSIHDFFPETGPDSPLVLFLAKLPPLPPGDHRLDFSIEMSARHCDGLGTDPAINCLNAGTTKLGVCPFKVVPRNEPGSRPQADPASIVGGVSVPAKPGAPPRCGCQPRHRAWKRAVAEARQSGSLAGATQRPAPRQQQDRLSAWPGAHGRVRRMLEHLPTSVSPKMAC